MIFYDHYYRKTLILSLCYDSCCTSTSHIAVALKLYIPSIAGCMMRIKNSSFLIQGRSLKEQGIDPSMVDWTMEHNSETLSAGSFAVVWGLEQYQRAQSNQDSFICFYSSSHQSHTGGHCCH
jgi:hypothetical protein